MDIMRHKILCAIALATLIAQLSVAATPQVESQKSKPILTDIALQKGGVLVGRLTGKKGKLRAQQKIVIRQNGQLVEEITTGKNGQFKVKGLRGGIYEIASEHGVGGFRAWTVGTAPPSAKQFAVLIDSNEVVRGQWGWVPAPPTLPTIPAPNFTVGEWLGITAGVAGLAVGTIALIDSDDAS